MKERPILFSGEMVRAILEGRKTMTRRVVKYIPDLGTPGNWCEYIKNEPYGVKGIIGDFRRYCPFGNVGDRLWVRETFRYSSGSAYTPKDKEPKYTATIEYRSTYNNSINGDRGVKTIITDKMEFCGNLRKDLSVAWKPSIFMPRRASRINLEITNIRVERLNHISEEDAEAEGVEYDSDRDKPWGGGHEDGGGYLDYFFKDEESFSCQTAKESFQTLWESINGKDSWEYNPFVWVIEFKKV